MGVNPLNFCTLIHIKKQVRESVIIWTKASDQDTLDALFFLIVDLDIQADFISSKTVFFSKLYLTSPLIV